MKASRDIDDLLAVMAALRTPRTGCPWDLDQTFASIVRYTIEEAYEVADAIARGDMIDLKDELGDLLLQVVFHARMAEEIGAFAFGDVVESIGAKMIRRHPHVFGDAGGLPVDEVNRLWEQIKADEKASRRAQRAAAGRADEAPRGLLSETPGALPALTRAMKLQQKASSVGFDWNDARLVLAKINEELAEIGEAQSAGDKDAIEGEIGDLLFAVVNLARHMKVDAESALRRTNDKFVRRFAHIENALAARGSSPEAATLAEMDALWDEAKAGERNKIPNAHPVIASEAKQSRNAGQ
jgi:ATP diphosphatase